MMPELRLLKYGYSYCVKCSEAGLGDGRKQGVPIMMGEGDHTWIETVIMDAKEYEKYRELMQRDLILVVECTVSVDDYNGGMRGRAKQVMTLAQARKKFAHRLALNLSSEDLQSGFCQHLANILEPYRKEPANAEVPIPDTAGPADIQKGQKKPPQKKEISKRRQTNLRKQQEKSKRRSLGKMDVEKDG